MADLQRKIENAASIVRDSGGKIVGRTRLQKVAYLLELAGLGSGYRFEYRYFGPYSKELSEDIRRAWAFDLVAETERPASWGGMYSIFETIRDIDVPRNLQRSKFAEHAASIDAIELELAATAAYLSVEGGYEDPWEETQRRKPDKASLERISAAKKAYYELKALRTPRHLPEL